MIIFCSMCVPSVLRGLAVDELVSKTLKLVSLNKPLPVLRVG